MPRMKHLLRKLHIGGGGGGGLEHQHQTHHRLAEPRPNTPPPPLTSPPVLSPSPSQASNSVSPTRDGPDSRGSGSRGEGASTTAGGGGSDFSLLEEEYQVQLALAISASDPNGIDDLDSVQIKAAKQLSLESVATAAGGGSGSSGSSECTMEFLSLRYWGYNVINYDEKLADGFYDVYGIISNPDQTMPSLVDLQSISISDTVDYEVALVNRVVDSALQQLERRALQIALECRATESGFIASGLIQKIAHLVAENMGGPVEDAEEMLRRWTVRSHELRTSLNTIVFPLGLLGVGLSRHRALLFKVLADRVDLPCKLVKGSYHTGTDDGAINLIKVDYGSEYIVDLMGAPGTLIPAEVPSSHLENSGAILHSSDTIEQSVKDLCLALDKVSFQLEDKIEGSAVSSSDNKLVSRAVHLPLQEKSHQLCKVDYLRVDGNFPADGAEKEVEMLGQTAGEIQRETLGFIGDISPAEQMKVNNVSKYVVTAAKNPEFAQKLHAVLLESGASPPLDLFSSLNTVHEAVDQKISMDNMNVGRKNGGLSGPSAISTMEADLSNSRYNEDVLRKDVEEMTGKQEQDSSLVANPAVSGNPSILRTNQGINLDTTESVGYPATEAAQKFDSKGTNNFDQHMSSGSLNESFNSLVVSVAEWEIPWEDLQIGERIGLGSYGEVYRADWNGTDVAVKKFLDQDLSGDALDLFRSEVKIMLRLRHPNVILFMGAVTRPPNLSILTEFLPRGSLYRLLHRPNVKLDERRRLKMALDVAKGMNYLHASHPTIVHRDLKSPNLLVDRNWVVKVCDFGLSRLKHHTFLSSKSTAGTPEWMAPEVLRNEPSNEKCDIYSFGVILWELATLRMPWSGMNPMQVVGAVGYQNKRLEIPQEIDPMVAKIITDCWESDPSQRPSFAQLLPPLKQLQRLVVPIS